MSVINVVFSDEQLTQLSNLQHTHPHPVIRRRALTMLLKQQVTQHHKIARITGVSENTVRAALQSYNDGGIELLTTVNYRKPSSKLKPFDADHRFHSMAIKSERSDASILCAVTN